MARVVHLTSGHRPTDIRIFEKQCRSLARDGYEVLLVVPHDKDEQVGGVRLMSVPLPRSRFRRLLLTPYEVFRRAMELDADLYHFHDPALLPWMQLLRLFKPRATIVYDMHENVPKSLLSKDWIPALLRQPIRLAYSALEARLMQGFGIIFAEHSYEDDYPNMSPAVTVLNMPIVSEISALSQPLQERARSLVYVGGVTQERGSRVMVSALGLLKQRQRRVELSIVGPASDVERKEILKLARSLGVDNQISLLGYKEPTAAWRCAGTFSIGLAVLARVPNYVESYPTKIFEYMALGLAVISSDFPLYRAIVEGEHVGRTVEPSSAEALANAIDDLLTSDEELAGIAQRGPKAVSSRYNWKSQYFILKRFYDMLLERQAAKARD